MQHNRARSSQNAVKHGLTSTKMFVLQNESPEAWRQMLQTCEEEFQPVNAFEHKLVEEIAFAKWRLRRAWIVETALFDHEMDEQADAFSNRFDAADEGTRLALAFQSLTENKAFGLLSRYESRLKRDYRAAIRALEDRRQKRQQGLLEARPEHHPDEPVQDPEPEPRNELRNEPQASNEAATEWEPATESPEESPRQELRNEPPQSSRNRTLVLVSSKTLPERRPDL